MNRTNCDDDKSLTEGLTWIYAGNNVPRSVKFLQHFFSCVSLQNQSRPQWRTGTSHHVGPPWVELIQCVSQSSSAAVYCEFTHLPASNWCVQVHVLHPTTNLTNPVLGQFVDDEPEKQSRLKNKKQNCYKNFSMIIVVLAHQSIGSPASFLQEMSVPLNVKHNNTTAMWNCEVQCETILRGSRSWREHSWEWGKRGNRLCIWCLCASWLTGLMWEWCTSAWTCKTRKSQAVVTWWEEMKALCVSQTNIYIPQAFTKKMHLNCLSPLIYLKSICCLFLKDWLLFTPGSFSLKPNRFYY